MLCVCQVDAIVDRSGSTVFAEIQGHIDCSVKLSGMPDLTMTFVNPRLFDDLSFHPCVRFKRWEAERLLSFIPPGEAARPQTGPARGAGRKCSSG